MSVCVHVFRVWSRLVRPCVWSCATKSSLQLKLLRLKIHSAYLFIIFFSAPLLLFILIGRKGTSSRIRDRLRSYCFWIPRLPWEHPIGTISCKYQSHFRGGRDYFFFFLGGLFFSVAVVFLDWCVLFSFFFPRGYYHNAYNINIYMRYR